MWHPQRFRTGREGRRSCRSTAGPTSGSTGGPADRQVVEILRRHGATGAVALLGADGVLRGARARLRVLSVRDRPIVTIVSVGPRELLARCLPLLAEALRDPVVTLEAITQVKHDGRLLESPPTVATEERQEPDLWQTIRVYTRRSAQVSGQALYSELTRRLREAGAAGATTVLGDWGFSSDEPAHGDRLGRFGSHRPSYTVYIDRPERVAEVWPVIDEVTAEHGVVTSVLVPGYRERTGKTTHGSLDVAERAAWVTTLAQRHVPERSRPVAARPGDHWTAELVRRARAFAELRGGHAPIVRVTLENGERFFLFDIEPGPGDTLVTLYPHPARYAEMLRAADGAPITPRAVVVRQDAIAEVEFLHHVPRGTRSLVTLRPSRLILGTRECRDETKRERGRTDRAGGGARHRARRARAARRRAGAAGARRSGAALAADAVAPAPVPGLRQLGDGRLRGARRRHRRRDAGGAGAAARWSASRAPGTRRRSRSGPARRSRSRPGRCSRRAPTRWSGSRTRAREDGAVLVEVEARAGAERAPRRRGHRRRGDGAGAPAPRLGAAELGVLASLGLDPVACVRRPRVAVLTSGDELTRARRAAARRARSATPTAYSVPALARLAGRRGRLASPGRRTSRRRPEAALGAALEADVAIVCGGVSVGEHDHVKAALARARRRAGLLAGGAAARRPTWFGPPRRRRWSSACPATRSRRWSPSCSSRGRRCWRSAAATRRAPRTTRDPRRAPTRSRPGAPTPCAAGSSSASAAGSRTRSPRQGSHVLTSMLGADCLALIPADERRPRGRRAGSRSSCSTRRWSRPGAAGLASGDDRRGALFAILRERAGARRGRGRAARGGDGRRRARPRSAPSRPRRAAGADAGADGGQPRVRRAEARALAAGDELALIPPVSGGAPTRDGPRCTRGSAPSRSRSTRSRRLRRPTPAPAPSSASRASPARSTGSSTRPTARWPRSGSRAILAECVARHGLSPPPPSTGSAPVPLGEPSVVVAVSAAHREEAFAGAREAIDRIKAEAPIWKREVEAAARRRWVEGARPDRADRAGRKPHAPNRPVERRARERADPPRRGRARPDGRRRRQAGERAAGAGAGRGCGCRPETARAVEARRRAEGRRARASRGWPASRRRSRPAS